MDQRLYFEMRCQELLMNCGNCCLNLVTIGAFLMKKIQA